VAGPFLGRLGASTNIMGALYKGLIVTAIVSAILIAGIIGSYVGFGTTFQAESLAFTGTQLFGCAVVGLAVTGLLVWITEYYTSTAYRPVRSVAKASTTGHAPHNHQGVPVSIGAC